MHPVYQHPATTALLRAALAEDLGSHGDLTVQSVVAPGSQLTGQIIAKAPGVLVGAVLFELTCELIEPGAVHVSDVLADGSEVAAGAAVLQCRGDAAVILQAERTALNAMQRLSGCATTAQRYAAMVAGTAAKVFDTRKTTPGFRYLEKHAVACGGGANHRVGLFDQVLIKENHIALMPPDAGSGPAAAVQRARAHAGDDAVIQVEIERLDDLEPVIAAGADLVLLDNMDCDQLRAAVACRDRVVAADARPVALEASGGITDATLRAVAETGVERISIGALTHSVTALDLSLRCSVA